MSLVDLAFCGKRAKVPKQPRIIVARTAMPRRLRLPYIVTVTLVFVGIVAAGIAFLRPDSELHELDDDVRQKLRSFNVPTMDVTEDLEQAVAQFEPLCRQALGSQFTLQLWKGQTPPGNFHRYLSSIPAAASSSSRTIIAPTSGAPSQSIPSPATSTLIDNKTPALEQTLCRIFPSPLDAALGFGVERGKYSLGQASTTLYVVPGDGTFSPLVERTFELAPALIHTLASDKLKHPLSSLYSYAPVEAVDGSYFQVTREDRIKIVHAKSEMFLFEAAFGAPVPPFWERLRVRIGNATTLIKEHAFGPAKP